MTMRILVAGGLGFVGGRIAVHLANAGHQIILGSRNSIYSPPWLRAAEVIQIDWNDDSALDQICKGVDVIIDAAGINARDCAVDPVAALAFNGVATARLVAAACRADVQKFIYLSTAHVYASPLVGTITEETCTRNLHPYATSHLSGEHAVLSADKLRQIQGIVLRLSNAFGAPMHKEVNCWMLLVNDLCRQAVEKQTLMLQTNGLQQRDFIGLASVCRVVEHLAVRLAGSVEAGIFNVGAGASQTVFAITQLIQQRCTEILGFEPTLRHPQGDPEENYPPLLYQVKKLTSLGISMNSHDNTREIDVLLYFCQSIFSSHQKNGT